MSAIGKRWGGFERPAWVDTGMAASLGCLPESSQAVNGPLRLAKQSSEAVC